MRGVSFFFDANENGGWDNGIDTDLGSDFDGSNGWSVAARALSSWGTPAAAQFVATAVTTTGAWGRAGTASSGVRINDRTTLTNLLPSNANVAQNASVTFTLNVLDAWGASVVTIFADIDGSGFWTPGVDIDLGIAARISGTVMNGAWSLTVTANWATGTTRIVADARDSDGAWSGRRVNTMVTVA